MLFSIYSQTEQCSRSKGFFGEPLGSSDNPTWAIFGNAELAMPKAEFSSEDRVFVNMEGGTATAAHTGVTGEGGAVEVRAQGCRTVACRSAGGGKRWRTGRQGAFDAENSDPAASSDALTMTALAFDAECSDLDADLNECMRPIGALEKGTAENSFFQSGVGTVLRKMPLDSKRATRLRDEIG